MPQHKKLSQLTLRIPDQMPKNDAEWQSFKNALQGHFNAVSGLDICSGLTAYDDTTNEGYFLGYAKNVSGVPDGTPVFALRGDNARLSIEGANSTFFVGDRDTGEYFEFDGTDLRVGYSTQFQGADAYNNNTTYFHTFFESIDNAVTSGTPAFNTADGTLEVASGDVVYRPCSETIGALSFSSDVIRVKSRAIFSAVTGVATTTHGYILTGSRGGSNSGFGFKAVGDGTGGMDWHGVSIDLGTETVSGNSITANVSGNLLEAVLQNGAIKFYNNGAEFDEITTGLPTNGSGKGALSQRCLYYLGGGTGSTETLGVSEFRLLHERTS